MMYLNKTSQLENMAVVNNDNSDSVSTSNVSTPFWEYFSFQPNEKLSKF